jgi:sortase A
MISTRLFWRAAEIGSWAVGITLLIWFAQATFGQRWLAERDTRVFLQTTEANAKSADKPESATFESVQAPDQTDWSAIRRNEYLASLSAPIPPPLAVLRIPSVGIEVPVYHGTSDAVLNRGAGWIEGTAKVDAMGNIGIAAHRDSYFRALKDIRAGAALELQLPNELRRFRVESTQIVTPDVTSVLDEGQRDSVTLITCYPFYFVGHAPKRFIVHAIDEAAVHKPQ